MRRIAIACFCIAVVGLVPAVAHADQIKIGRWSQQEGPSKASVSASIAVHGARSGRDFAKLLETIRQLNAVQGTAELYRSHGDVRMPANLLVNLDRLVVADQAD